MCKGAKNKGEVRPGEKNFVGKVNKEKKKKKKDAWLVEGALQIGDLESGKGESQSRNRLTLYGGNGNLACRSRVLHENGLPATSAESYAKGKKTIFQGEVG